MPDNPSIGVHSGIFTKQALLDRKLCQKSLYYLCKEVLGYKDMVPHVHGDLTFFATHPSFGRFRQATLPRSWFKTWVWTIAKSIWLTLPDEYNLYTEIYPYKGPNIRLLIASNVIDNASKMIFKIKQEWMSNDRLQAAFPELIPDFNKTRWSDHVAEVKRDLKATEGTYTAVGVGGSVISQHFDHIIEDDLIYARKDDFTGQELMPSQEDIDNAIGWHKLSYSLLSNPKTSGIDNVGCLVKGTKVLLADNTWREIQYIRVGELLQSVQGKEKVNRVVEAVIPQGIAPVYELRTANTTITATGTHPILTLREGQLEFVRLDKLSKGDLVVSVKLSAATKISGLSQDACWFLGLMLGDGWTYVKYRHYAVCLATGVDEEQNAKARRIARNEFGIELSPTKFGYDRADSVVAKHLHSLGIVGTAKTKRVPAWVFQDTVENRQAFIRGFLAADGTKSGKGRFSAEIANQSLLEDFRLLSLISGFRVTNVYSRKRMIQAPHSNSSVLSETYHAAFSVDAGTLKSAILRHRVKNKKFLEPSLCFDTVRLVRPVGESEVWDLTVEGTHNFFANGVCTHNTRWAPQDLIYYIRKFEKDFSCFEIAVTKEGLWPIMDDSACVWPERYDCKTLEKLCTDQGIRIFECFPAEAPILKSDWSCVPISELKIGDEVVGFVRGKTPSNGKLVKSYVTLTECLQKDVVKITLASGKVIRCTADHPWYTGREDKSHSSYLPAKVGCKLKQVYDYKEISYQELLDYRYLAGIIDGEGACNHGNIAIGQSKAANPDVYYGIESVLKRLKIPYSIAKVNPNDVHILRNKEVRRGLGETFVLNGGRQLKGDIVRFGKPAKAERILNTIWRHPHSIVHGEDSVISIEPDGHETVYAIGTTSGNYVAYGYATKNTQYLNRPRASSDIVFRREYVNLHESINELPVGIEYKTIVDLAGWGDSKGSARNVILTGGRDIKNHLWIARLDAGRYTPSEVISLYKQHSRQFHSTIHIEEIQYQRAISHFSREEMERTGEWFHQERLPYDGRRDAKNLRIRALEPVITNGSLHILISMNQLLEELEFYPYSKTVDILDCLGYLHKIARASFTIQEKVDVDPFKVENIEKEIKAKCNSAVGYPFDEQANAWKGVGYGNS